MTTRKHNKQKHRMQEWSQWIITRICTPGQVTSHRCRSAVSRSATPRPHPSALTVGHHLDAPLPVSMHPSHVQQGATPLQPEARREVPDEWGRGYSKCAHMAYPSSLHPLSTWGEALEWWSENCLCHSAWPRPARHLIRPHQPYWIKHKTLHWCVKYVFHVGQVIEMWNLKYAAPTASIQSLFNPAHVVQSYQSQPRRRASVLLTLQAWLLNKVNIIIIWSTFVH